LAADAYLAVSFSAAVGGLEATGLTVALSMAAEADFLASSFLAAFSNIDFGPEAAG